MTESGSGGRGDRSWWQTLPGILTAIAALLTAITGFVVAMQQLRPTASVAPTPRALVATTAPGRSDGPGGAGAAVGTATTAGATAYQVSLPSGGTAIVGDAHYAILSAVARPGNPGELRLTLTVRMTNENRYPANFWSATFRLRDGTDTSAPTNLLDELVDGGTTKTGEVDFALAANAAQATLLVGDDPARAIALPLAITATP